MGRSLSSNLTNFKLRLSLLPSRRLEVDEQAVFNAENFHVIPQLLLLAFAQLAADSFQFDHDRWKLTAYNSQC
jgi:hypothetical protein